MMIDNEDWLSLDIFCHCQISFSYLKEEQNRMNSIEGFEKI